MIIDRFAVSELFVVNERPPRSFRARPGICGTPPSMENPQMLSQAQHDRAQDFIPDIP